MGRGGKREGAGRPPSPEGRKIAMAVKLSRDVVAYLSTKENKTAAIEESIRKSKGFRDWKKESSE